MNIYSIFFCRVKTKLMSATIVARITFCTRNLHGFRKYDSLVALSIRNAAQLDQLQEFCEDKICHY